MQDVVVNFAKFPPYGQHVKGLSVGTYQSLLTSIERRTQLYAIVPGAKYNARYVTTLDVENFFGSFQDYDQKGSGVMRADEIALAMTTASEMYQTRLMGHNER